MIEGLLAYVPVVQRPGDIVTKVSCCPCHATLQPLFTRCATLQCYIVYQGDCFTYRIRSDGVPVRGP